MTMALKINTAAATAAVSGSKLAGITILGNLLYFSPDGEKQTEGLEIDSELLQTLTGDPGVGLGEGCTLLDEMTHPVVQNRFGEVIRGKPLSFAVGEDKRDVTTFVVPLLAGVIETAVGVRMPLGYYNLKVSTEAGATWLVNPQSVLAATARTPGELLAAAQSKTVSKRVTLGRGIGRIRGL